MGEQRILQKRITVTGDTSTGEPGEQQPMDDFLDVSGWSVAFVTVHTFEVSTAAGDDAVLGIPTCGVPTIDGLEALPDGPGGPCIGFDLSSNEWYRGVVTREAEPYGSGTYPMENLIGWNLALDKTGAGGAFSIAFEVFVTLKKPS